MVSLTRHVQRSSIQITYSLTLISMYLQALKIVSLIKITLLKWINKFYDNNIIIIVNMKKFCSQLEIYICMVKQS